MNLKAGFLVMMTVILSVPQSLRGQVIHGGIDPVYGLDPVLYNGKVYSDFIRNVSSGNQYFTGEEFSTGRVKIRDIWYESLELNYDLHHQELLLKYVDVSGSVRIIALSKARIEAFGMEGKHFIIFSSEDSDRQIYQLIGDNELGCCYRWDKILKLDATYGAGQHYFSDAARQSFLMRKGTLVKFRNNRSFVSLFPTEVQPLIRRYLRLYRLNVRNADDRAMDGLIRYCSNPR